MSTKIKIIGTTITAIIVGIVVTNGVIQEEYFDKLKNSLVDKMDNWEMCVSIGKIISNEDGIYTECEYNGKTYEAFTLNDFEILINLTNMNIENNIKIKYKKGDNLLKTINEKL